MCLILFSYNAHPPYRFILAANRDEFHARPTAPAQWWPADALTPSILGGRDLLQGGSWLAIGRNGRFAAVTNYRNPALERPDGPSRGKLVNDFLASTLSAEAYLQKISLQDEEYSGYNLLVGDFSSGGDGLWYHANHLPGIHPVAAGIHGLSNAFLDTRWPKVEHGKHLLKKTIATASQADADNQEALSAKPEAFFALLHNTAKAPKDALPSTGIPRERERNLSAMFIEPLDISNNLYGTRCSTFLAIDDSGNVTFTERVYFPEAQEELFQFKIEG